jgi:ElaB/YqjD/DUF883 family membrane-anchored ribosome-binding protein
VAQERNEGIDANDTAEIKSEIERTRVEMSETLGEIQERLRPDHLIQQAKDSVTEAASGKVRNMMHSAGETATRVADQTRYAGRSVADYASAHPLQMAVIAGGLTWWLLRSRGDRYATDYSEYNSDYDTELAYGAEPTLRDRAGDYVSTARETVGEYAESARTGARRAAARVRETASNASIRAQRTWQRTSTSVDDWVHDYPMAAGALAVAVGAAIGLSVPSSDWEDRTLGERRDRAMEAARSKAREIKDNVTERAKNVADTVAELTAPPASATGATGATGAGGVGISGTSPSTTGRV